MKRANRFSIDLTVDKRLDETNDIFDNTIPYGILYNSPLD